MPRKKPDIFYIYKTTNLINKKFYIGKHCTTKIENDYLGSGKRLRYSVRKYGVENFKKEILEFCENQKMLAEREKEIVNQEMLNNSLCMNLQLGGGGGFINKEHQSKACKAGGLKHKSKLKENPDYLKNWIKKTQEGFKKYVKNSDLSKRTKSFLNKKHTEESKLKMSLKKKGKIGLKENNSQFNTIWVKNNTICKKIKREELDIFLSQGYTLGRFINK